MRLPSVLRRLARSQAGLPSTPAAAGWARTEAERLLSDDQIAGDFMLGEDVDAPPEVIAEMASIVRELESQHDA